MSSYHIKYAFLTLECSSLMPSRTRRLSRSPNPNVQPQLSTSHSYHTRRSSVCRHSDTVRAALSGT